MKSTKLFRCTCISVIVLAFAALSLQRQIAFATETTNTDELDKAENIMASLEEMWDLYAEGGVLGVGAIDEGSASVISCCSKVIESNPKESRAFLTRARAYYLWMIAPPAKTDCFGKKLTVTKEDESTLFKKALSDYNQALSLNSNLKDAHMGRAELVGETDPKLAIQDCNFVLAQRDVVRVANVLKSYKAPAQPVRSTNALAKYARHPSVFDQVPPDELPAFRAAMNLYGRAMNVRAKAYEKTGKLSNAISDCTIAFSLSRPGSPAQFELLKQRASLYERSGNAGLAKQDQEAIRTFQFDGIR